jgi:parvulin-like peptidyl-prolyl isomerase
MKRLFWIFMVAVAATAGAADLVDRVLARVNDSIISQSEFESRAARLAKDSAAPADPARLRLAVLEQMIRQKLVEGKAAALDLKVGSDEIDESLERVKEQYALKDDAEFDKALASNGLSRETLRSQLHDSILTNKLLAREVPVNLNDDVVRTEYERTKEKRYPIPEKARVSEIVVHFDAADPASREAAMKKINEARGELKAAKSFAEVARAYSEGPARSRGGDLGIVSKGDLTADLDAAIFSGAPADPVELKDGFVLLSITDRQKATFRPFDEVKEEIRKRLSDEIYEKKFGDYLSDLRKNAFVKIFDKDLSSQDEAFQRDKPSS